MRIAGVPIGHGYPCRTIGEISCNHNGSLQLAFKLMDAAKDAGADFVKIQAYTPAELVALRGDGPAPEPWGSQGWTMLSLYEKAKTPSHWWPELFRYAEIIGIPLFASVFGAESLAAMEALGCPAYKIASLDSENFDLLHAILPTKKPLFESWSKFPGHSWADCNLWCPPGYPQTKLDLTNFQPHDQRRDSSYYDGFSYHGTDPTVPVYAVVAGAKVIECHLQLDDAPSELEANVSLTASQFRTMVNEIRKVETML